jgi:hypothetical protein
MNTHTAGQQLHDRATRGEALSDEERAQLQEWYAQLDREESATLNKNVRPASIAALQAQIETALAQLATVTQRIQALTSENAELGREIASLQSLLVQKLTPQST